MRKSNNNCSNNSNNNNNNNNNNNYNVFHFEEKKLNQKSIASMGIKISN